MAKSAPQQTKRLYGDRGGRDPAASDDRLGARPCENVHERGARSIVFLYLLSPLAVVSAFSFQTDEIEKNLLRAV